MTLGAWLTFIAASAALIAIPGPNVAIIVVNSMAHGRRYGLVTVAGTSAATVPQLTLTVAGMTGALALASQAFEWVRWLEVAYLVWLGIQAWRAPPLNLTEVGPKSRGMRAIFARGFLVSYGLRLMESLRTHAGTSESGFDWGECLGVSSHRLIDEIRFRRGSGPATRGPHALTIRRDELHP